MRPDLVPSHVAGRDTAPYDRRTEQAGLPDPGVEGHDRVGVSMVHRLRRRARNRIEPPELPAAPRVEPADDATLHVDPAIVPRGRPDHDHASDHDGRRGAMTRLSGVDM